MKNISAGVDFGTTNTVAAITDDKNNVKTVILEKNRDIIPTTIFFKDASPDILFGTNAIDSYINSEPGRFMRSLKRILGTSSMKTGTLINGKMVSFAQIIETFLRNIKSEIDTSADQNVENLVMGRPVKFRDNDDAGDERAENELLEISKKAGFKNIHFQFEPIAAAFSHERNLMTEKNAFVIDIGGGTSDFSIIKIGGKNKDKTDRTDDILANTGVRIGGNDFDKQLSLKTFMPQLGMGTLCHPIGKPDIVLPVPSAHYFELSEWSNINNLYNRKTIDQITKHLKNSLSPETYGRLSEVISQEFGHHVLSIVENTKIKLTESHTTNIILDFLSNPTNFYATRLDFEKSIAKDVQTIEESIKECLNQSGMQTKDIDLIILTGGSTEIPYVREHLCKYFPCAEISDGNKFSSVGLGLGYDALRIFK